MFFEWNRISRVKGRVRSSRACWREGRHLTSRDDSMTMCLSKSQDYTSQTKILEGWTDDETNENQDVIFCSSFRNRRLGSIKFLSDFSIVNGQNLVLVPLNCIFLPRTSSGEHKDDDSEHAMMIVFFQNFNFFEWNRISRVKGRVRASRVKGSRRQLVPFFLTISISTNVSRWICGWHFCRNVRNGDCREKGD